MPGSQLPSAGLNLSSMESHCLTQAFLEEERQLESSCALKSRTDRQTGQVPASNQFSPEIRVKICRVGVSARLVSDSARHALGVTFWSETLLRHLMPRLPRLRMGSVSGLVESSATGCVGAEASRPSPSVFKGRGTQGVASAPPQRSVHDPR